MTESSVIPHEALGSGLQFPIRINQRGGWAVTKYEEKVKESIKVILSTAKGERVMRPDFGCNIYEFVFTTLDSTNLTLIKSAVREALLRWEPRIEINEIDVKPDTVREGRLLVYVAYTIRATNSADNLVYPFHLHTGP
jgi:phage baseplate assembly protein W